VGDFSAAFERRIREVASRAVAHLKRGDTVVVRTTTGLRVVADRTVGADLVLRFLALVEAVDEADARSIRPPATSDEPVPAGREVVKESAA
jgi:hypothetical protein